MNTPCKSLGIAVARLIYKGYVHDARMLASDCRTWTLAERKAIIGAGKSLLRFGIPNGVSLAKGVMGLK